MPSMTWNNGSTTYTLPPPEKKGGLHITPVFVGSERVMLSGKSRVDKRQLKHRIDYSSKALTAAEYSGLMTAFNACAEIASTLTLPSGKAFTVYAILAGVDEDEEYDIGDTCYTHVKIVFTEVG